MSTRTHTQASTQASTSATTNKAQNSLEDEPRHEQEDNKKNPNAIESFHLQRRTRQGAKTMECIHLLCSLPSPPNHGTRTHTHTYPKVSYRHNTNIYTHFYYPFKRHNFIPYFRISIIKNI